METYMMMFSAVIVVMLVSITTITICRESIFVLRRGVEDVVEYSLVVVLSVVMAAVSSTVLGTMYGITF